MLKQLHIENYAIIDHLDLEFRNGLTIITGETGAGKSILLGALGLILGNRADSKVLFNAEKKCFVEAVFDISGYPVTDYLKEEDLYDGDELIIRREIASNGKSRAFINDTPTTLEVLNAIAEKLVDLHQQFDTLDIHREDFQTDIIDALAGQLSEKKSFQQKYFAYKSHITKRQQLTERLAKTRQEYEFLSFQLKELNDARLENGEQHALEEELSLLTNAGEIKQVFESLMHVVEEGEHNVRDLLKPMVSRLNSISHLSPLFLELSKRLDESVEELADIARESSKIADQTEVDNERINIVQERLNLIYKLQKKYGVNSLGDLIKVRDDIESKLSAFTSADEELVGMASVISALSDELNRQAKDLHDKRKTASKILDEKLAASLAELKMEHASVKTEVHTATEFNAHGKDNVQLLFSPNKGSAYLSIKQSASGGELSRLNLCIKSLVANTIQLPTLIFDEIDAGVSGDVAMKMGNLIRKLADHHQVITITHSPQVASRADMHYMVYKNHQQDRTFTGVKILNSEEQIVEIAKMLGGDPPSAKAIETARELKGI
jgi:DNA repair protein RecN (Recombination protein N)